MCAESEKSPGRPEWLQERRKPLRAFGGAGPGGSRRTRARRGRGGGAAGSEGHPDTRPVGRGHRPPDLDGRPAEVPAVAAHPRGAALTVAQVDGRQRAPDEVGRVAALALEEAGGSPVLAGRGGHCPHRDATPLRGASRPVLLRLPGPEGICSRPGASASLAARRDSASRPGPSPAGRRPAPCTRPPGDRPPLLSARPLADSLGRDRFCLAAKFSPAHLLRCQTARAALSFSPSWTHFRGVPQARSQSLLARPRRRLHPRLAAASTRARRPPGRTLRQKTAGGRRDFGQSAGSSPAPGPSPVSLGVRSLHAPVSL
ncbi:EZH inhibitory protein-like [Homo sapiens]|uniref:EZH inhibitory protein-like n=1 Tax=Homo sapiens TaxID=9606 RepID=UPI001FB1294F|nr:EZH inhibitory protein-like [Homo sapiens]